MTNCFRQVDYRQGFGGKGMNWFSVLGILLYGIRIVDERMADPEFVNGSLGGTGG
jgi:hypothetical protein